MQLFSHSSPESKGRSFRLGSRAYIIIAASIATILLITALEQPAPVSIAAQATVTVPPLAAAHNQDARRQSWAERLTSEREVRDAEDRVILAENAIAEFVNEQVEHRREELFAIRVRQAEEQYRAQVLQPVQEAEQRAIDERAAQEELGAKPGFDLEASTSDAVPLPPEEINMVLELARIKKSDTYRDMQERLVEAKQGFAAVIDQSGQTAGQLVTTEASRVVGQPGRIRRCR